MITLVIFEAWISLDLCLLVLSHFAIQSVFGHFAIQSNEGVVAQWCNPLTLQSEQSEWVRYPVGPHNISVMTRVRRPD